MRSNNQPHSESTQTKRAWKRGTVTFRLFGLKNCINSAQLTCRHGGRQFKNGRCMTQNDKFRDHVWINYDKLLPKLPSFRLSELGLPNLLNSVCCLSNGSGSKLKTPESPRNNWMVARFFCGKPWHVGLVLSEQPLHFFSYQHFSNYSAEGAPLC